MADRFVTRLGGELAAWVREGIITEDQRARIAARYRETGAPSRFVAILGIIGGALVASGLALVIAHNWEAISDWTKIGGIVALMAGFYAGGFILRERGHAGSGEAFLMVGGALFLCGIALVGQIYHLNARPPNAVLLWIAALFPIAYLLRSTPVLFLGISGFLVWIGMEAERTDSFLYVGDGAGDWFLLGFQTLILPVGVALAAAGPLHGGSWLRFRSLFEGIGITVTGACLYALGFLQHTSRWRSELLGSSPYVLFPVVPFALAAVGLAAASFGRYPHTQPRTRAAHVGWMLASVALAFAPGVCDRLGLPGRETAVTLTLVYWVVLFLFSLHLIAAGVRWERPGWITLGILFVGLNIVTRYFDVLGNRLDQGLLYILGGVLILAVSFVLERQRRKLLRQMAQEAVR